MALPIVDKMASVAASTASATKTVASKLTSDPKDESKAIAKQQGLSKSKGCFCKIFN